MEQPILIRRLYEHVSKKVFIVVGISKPLKASDKAQVILSSLERTEEEAAAIFTCPVESFFDKHPTEGTPRFQLVEPSVKTG